MRLTLQRTAGILLAVVVLTTGAAAALPGNSPDSAGTDNDGSAGPPGDLPGPVPDFVSTIHDLVSQFIDGTLDGSLGDVISDRLGGDGATPTPDQSS